MINVVENFFSIQGEGRRAGKPSLFIRFFGCNLCCVGFGQPDPANPDTYHKVEFKKGESPKYGCDSPHSWHKMFKDDCAKYETISNYVDYLVKTFPPYQLKELVITGGEPMLQQENIVELVKGLKRHSKDFARFVTIETNGSIMPTPFFKSNFGDFIEDTYLLFSVSPKLNCVAGVSEKISISYEALLEIIQNKAWDYQLKFVYNGDNRANEKLKEIVSNLSEKFEPLKKSLDKILLMPVGAHFTDKQLMKKTAEFCLEQGFSYCPRLHVDIWGKETGV